MALQPTDDCNLRHLLSSAFGLGLNVVVDYGEGNMSPRCHTTDDVVSHLEAADIECLLFFHVNAIPPWARVLLVHGNEDGVLFADWSGPPSFMDLVKMATGDDT